MTIRSRWTAPIPRCSLQQWIFGSANDDLPDRKAFIDPERPTSHYLTVSDYRLLSKRVALGLLGAGLPSGGRVLVFSGNNLYFPSLFLGVLMAGGVFTGANPLFTPRELAYQLRDSQASFLFVAEYALDTALEAAKEVGLPKERIFVFGGDATGADVTGSDKPAPGKAGGVEGTRHWTELLEDNLQESKRWRWAEPKDPEKATCCLNYSSGTTGVPKGVEISHHSYVANGVGVLTLGEQDPDYVAFRERQRGLCFLPMYHAYAQTYFVANFVRMGIPVYVMPAFDFEKMLTYIEKFRITTLTCVPPIVVALAKHPLTKKFDLSSIEGVGSGAAPLSREISDDIERMFAANKVMLRNGWGMTEVTCTCLSYPPTYMKRSAGVGELMPNCAARIMELDGKTEITKANKPGELWVTGPTLMLGYWKKAAATRDTMHVDKDGTRWLKTGDIAFVDHYGTGGVFHIVDRLKELIKVKGNQVAPAELEALLLERPDVADAAVIGVTIAGEELPRAYVILADDESKVTPREIQNWVARKVARYKQLKGGVVFTDYIPKNPSGKILRKILREQAAKEMGDTRSRL